jgi:cytochrome c2
MVILLLAVLALSVRARVLAQPDSMLLTVDLPDRPAAGAKLFETKSCASCHSVGNIGRATIGPDLGRIVFFGDVLDLAGAFLNHAPAMQEKMASLGISRATLTGQEAAELVAFLTAFRYYDTQIREAGNPALGRTVFLDKGCAGCHESAAGRPASGPDLRKYRGRYAPIMFTQAMWNHAPSMVRAMREQNVPVPTFRGREMTDLAAYLQVGLSTRGPDPVVFEPGSPKQGQALFATKGCRTCHAVAGEGGQGGPDLGARGRAMVRSVPELAGFMWNHGPAMNAEFTRRGIVRPTFSGQEMADIVAYLYFVNYATVRAMPSRGERTFVRQCGSCHTLGRVAVGPDLLSAPGLDRPIGIVAAMWNHATAMERQATRQGGTWPRLERGETADLAAFLISRRASKGPSAPAGR